MSRLAVIRRCAGMAGLLVVLFAATGDAALAAATPKPLQQVGSDVAADFGPRPPAKPAAPSTFPRNADGHPDFTGVWFAGIRDFVTIDDRELDVPLTPDYQSVRRARVKAMNDGKPLPDYVSTCQAFGMPRIMGYGTFEIAHRPKQLWLMSEVMHEVRRVYLDGKPHGEWLEPSFVGLSVGHWQGDTLVVTTNKLRPGFMSMTGVPYSDSLTIVERIRMVNRNAIEDEMTLTDPVALTRPWKVVQRYERRAPDYEIGEYICTENNVSGGTAADVDPRKVLPPSALSADR